MPMNPELPAIRGCAKLCNSIERNTCADRKKRPAGGPNPVLVQALCQTWNHATNPAALRTDDEHRVCRKIARAIDRRLKRLGAREGVDWRELSNGLRIAN
jgi:hypothetical protein